jgi:hypothetical protein
MEHNWSEKQGREIRFPAVKEPDVFSASFAVFQVSVGGRIPATGPGSHKRTGEIPNARSRERPWPRDFLSHQIHSSAAQRTEKGNRIELP